MSKFTSKFSENFNFILSIACAILLGITSILYRDSNNKLQEEKLRVRFLESIIVEYEDEYYKSKDSDSFTIPLPSINEEEDFYVITL